MSSSTLRVPPVPPWARGAIGLADEITEVYGVPKEWTIELGERITTSIVDTLVEMSDDLEAIADVTMYARNPLEA